MLLHQCSYRNLPHSDFLFRINLYDSFIQNSQSIINFKAQKSHIRFNSNTLPVLTSRIHSFSRAVPGSDPERPLIARRVPDGADVLVPSDAGLVVLVGEVAPVRCVVERFYGAWIKFKKN